MKITGLNKEGKEVYFSGYTNEETMKGLGSGALTGTNRVPYFSTSGKDAKNIMTYIDAKRIIGEIIDSIKYKEIEGINFITIHFEKEDK